MDPVGTVGAARHHAVQEAHLVALLQDLDALVADAGQPIGERRQLVVVGREERPAAEAGRVVDELDDGLGDRDAVVGRGPPPHLVEHDQ